MTTTYHASNMAEMNMNVNGMTFTHEIDYLTIDGVNGVQHGMHGLELVTTRTFLLFSHCKVFMAA